MSKIVRWGIWGAGEVARRVAGDMKRVRGAVLHSVGSRTLSSAQKLASEHGAQLATADLGELLADPEVDVIYIATPHHLHAHDAIQCLGRGKAVLCEKPMATDAKQVAAISAAAIESKSFCMEAMWTRFIPGVQQAMKWAREGVVGDIVGVLGDFSHPVAYQPDSRFFSPELAGGALWDRGVYLVSLSHALLGEPTRVQASVRKAPTGIDASTAFLLEFEGGAVGQFSASLVDHGSNSFTIQGSRGRIVLHEPFVCAHRVSVEVYKPYVPAVRADEVSRTWQRSLKDIVKGLGLHRRLDSISALRKQLSSRYFVFEGEGYQFELEEVMNCLRKGKLQSDIMSLEDSLAIARTMERVRATWQ